MSKAFEMISESLNEIIEDFEKNDGKNLKREILTEEKNFNCVKSKKNYVNERNSENFYIAGQVNSSKIF